MEPKINTIVVENGCTDDYNDEENKRGPCCFKLTNILTAATIVAVIDLIYYITAMGLLLYLLDDPVWGGFACYIYTVRMLLCTLAISGLRNQFSLLIVPHQSIQILIIMSGSFICIGIIAYAVSGGASGVYASYLQIAVLVGIPVIAMEIWLFYIMYKAFLYLQCNETKRRQERSIELEAKPLEGK